MLDQRTRVRAFFERVGDTWADRYERRPRRMADLDLWLRRYNAQRLLRPLLSVEQHTATLVCLGCGPGNDLDGVPRDGLQVVGIDLVPEMARFAALRNPSDRYVAGDVAMIPLDSGCADVIVCLGVLEYTVNPHRVLAEIARILRPHGTLIVSFPNRRGLFRWLSRYEMAAEEVLLRWVRRVISAKGRTPVPNRRPYDHTQWTFAEAGRMLAAAGFDTQAVLFNTFGFTGQIGRIGAGLALSQWLSERWGHVRGWGAACAQTMVFHCVLRARDRQECSRERS